MSRQKVECFASLLGSDYLNSIRRNTCALPLLKTSQKMNKFKLVKSQVRSLLEANGKLSRSRLRKRLASKNYSRLLNTAYMIARNYTERRTNKTPLFNNTLLRSYMTPKKYSQNGTQLKLSICGGGITPFEDKHSRTDKRITDTKENKAIRNILLGKIKLYNKASELTNTAYKKSIKKHLDPLQQHENVEVKNKRARSLLSRFNPGTKLACTLCYPNIEYFVLLLNRVLGYYLCFAICVRY